MEDTRLHVLELLAQGPHTGPALAEACQITRTGVWKHIEVLRDRGFEISSTPAGYRLDTVPEYGGEAVAIGLDAPYRVEYRDTIESTNDIAREYADAGEDTVLVLADAQDQGRGRLGRDWKGPPGGIYMSILSRPTLAPKDISLLTLGAAVATSQAIESIGLEPEIKWPNDVLIDDRKVAGILTEMEGEADRVSWVIVGIGINANVDPRRLPDGATSLLSEHGSPVIRRTMVQEIVHSFDTLHEYPDRILPAWRNRTQTLGRNVRVKTPSAEIVGRAIDVVHPGALRIENEDGTHEVYAGDCEYLRPDA